MIEKMLENFERKKQQQGKGLRASFGIFAGYVGLLTNFVLFAAKFLIGLLSHSVSIMADAINNLSDAASSVMTLVGFRIASKPADREHPYGHERFEYISGMMISLLITFVGLQFFKTSIERIIEPQAIKMSPVMFVILVISVAVKLWQSLFYRKVAQKIGSEALVASAKDSLNDVYTTGAVLISAGVQAVTGWQIDGFVGLLLAVYILYSGVQMIIDFVNELLGQRPNQAELDQMRHHLSQVPDIVGYHDLLVHNYGPNKRFASVHIEVDDRWSLEKAHEVIDRIEKDFRTNLDVELVCHVDPVNLHDHELARVRKELKEILQSFQQGLKMHDYHVAHEHGRQVLSFDLVVPKECTLTDEELAAAIQRKVSAKLGDFTVSIVFDRAYLL